MAKLSRRIKIDYHADLEKAARQMILVHRIDTLIRLILRTIIRTIRVKHAGIFLYDKEKQYYTIKVSKGKRGLKIPAGFTMVKKDNPIVTYFTDAKSKLFDRNFLIYDKINYYIRSCRRRGEDGLIGYLASMRELLSLYQAKACVPGFFRNDLVGILFLGAKETGDNFTSQELGFLSVLASDVVMAIQNAWLFEDLNKQLNVNKKLFLGTVTALASAIDAKDGYTAGHTDRVVSYAMEIARHCDILPKYNRQDFLENLRISALLHDIGKIGIPEMVLNKKGPLTEEERGFIYTHPLVGISILNPIKEFKDVMLGVKYHHERWDGGGYPSGLKGDEIPLIASIVAVADSFDAMTSNRSYRKALSKKEAVEEIKRNSGKQFSSSIVKAFLAACRDKKI